MKCFCLFCKVLRPSEKLAALCYYHSKVLQFFFLFFFFVFFFCVIHSLFFKQNFPHVGNAYMKLVVEMIYVLLVGKGCGLEKLGHWNTDGSNYRIQD